MPAVAAPPCPQQQRLSACSGSVSVPARGGDSAKAVGAKVVLDQAPPPRRGKSREIVAVYCRVERRRQTYEPAGLARRHKDNDLAVVVGTEFEELHHVPPLGASRAR